MKKKEKVAGITLVALVVTIVVLLILAGITIVYVFGDNGVFKLAQEAKNKTEAAMQNEQEYFNNLENMINEYTNGIGGSGTTNPQEPPTPTEPVETPIENIKSDWETIEKIAKEIAKDETITSGSEEATVVVEGKKYTINVGDIFEVKYNEEIKQVRVLGFKHDDLVDTGVYGGNHIKASISFDFVDCLGTHNINGTSTSNSTNISWEATEMRTFLEGSEGIGKLSNKNQIKQVKKQYIKTYYQANSVTTSNDYLWLLSCSEIWSKGRSDYSPAAYGMAIAKEGEQYKWYKDHEKGIDPSQNNNDFVKKPSSSGDASDWWLRSPHYNGSSYFCYVNSNGNSTNTSASSSYGVAPGFSI